jgi:putative Mg2+ transporter-C (MgtC) family protein
MPHHTLLPAMIPDLEILIRLGAATLLGMALGLDRELRGMSAGIRTHGIVALAAAAVTISGLLLYVEVIAGGGSADPLRTTQGIAQAIGFIGAGLVFATGRGRVHNLTSAASVWLATGIGIAAGAGQTVLALGTAGFGVFLLTVVRLLERLIPGSDKARED